MKKKLLVSAVALIAITSIYAGSVQRIDVEKAAGADFSIVPAGEPGIQKSFSTRTIDFKSKVPLRMDKDTTIIVDGVRYRLVDDPEKLPEKLTLVITDDVFLAEIIPTDSLRWTLEKEG